MTAWQSTVDRHLASLLAMADLGVARRPVAGDHAPPVTASAARQSTVDRHVTSLLAMTEDSVASLLAMTGGCVTAMATSLRALQ
jgi:hypothetical protein